MSGIDVYVTVEDITEKMLTYESIELHRSDTLEGSYTLKETESLVADTYYYTINNDDGTLNHWYKYRFHHDTGPADSPFSNPFRVDGVTRQRARQAAMAKYGTGIVIVNTGTVNTKVTTADYRFNTTLFRTDRGKGSWLLVATGNRVGDMRIVKSSSPTAGDLDVLPVFGGVLASGDEVEWHTLADPTVWNNALNRGMGRYFYMDRVPLQGISGQEEYDLSMIPWLIDPEQIHDVRHYPVSGLDLDRPYGIGGKWWRPRWDRELIILQIHPATTDLLYLECTRPMPPLYTDDSAAPPACAEELVAALAYDEVLAWLSRPGSGTPEERKGWREQRRAHLPELRRLLYKHRPKPRYGPAQLPYPPVAPTRFKAR